MIFESPQYLPIAIGFLVVGLAGLIVSLTLQRGPRRTPFLRFGGFLLLLLGLLSPAIEWPEPNSEATVLVDVSDSFNEQVAQESLTRIQKLSGDNLQLAYLPFAAEPAPFRESSLSNYRGARKSWNSLNVGETNIESALAKTVYGGSKNIILLSDGWETRGAVDKLLPYLNQRGVKIFPFVDERGGAEATKLELTRLSAPLVAAAEKSVDIRATIRNDYRTSEAGLLELFHGGKVIQKKMVKLDPGQESVIVGKSDPSKEGTQEVRAVFTPVNPKFPPSSKTIYVSGEKREKILMISGTADDARFLEDIFQFKKFRMESVVASGYQGKFPALSEFSVVLLNNVALPQLPSTFSSDFESFVRNGGGAAMIGGNRSFGLGGYLGSLVEKALPVDMVPPQAQQKRLNVAVSLVLDKSRSMANDDKIYYVKEAASAVVRSLKDDDFIEVIGFDASPFVVIKLAQLALVRGTAIDRINRLFPAGRTNLLPAMYESKRSLARVDAGRKHMIVLTDGKVPDAGPYYEELAGQLKNEGITLSTVLLGDETDTYQLRRMAQLGGGAFHQTTNATSLAKIFIDDIRVSTGERTLKESAQFNVRRGPSEIKTTEISAFPPIRGYVQTRPKSKAEIELVVFQADKADPLLASWKYGQGKSVAFTSDANGRWSSFWATWERFYNFWSDVVESLRPSRGANAENVKFDLRYKVEKGILKLDLSIFSPDAVGALVATLKQPNGELLDVLFTQDSPGHYLADVRDVTAGNYEFKAAIGKRSLTPISFGLSGDLFGEKQGLGSNVSLLENLALRTGGIVNPTKEEILASAEVKKTRYPLSHTLIALGALLLLAEIILREVGYLFKRRIKA
jgi:Ca-activated chloride channel family protein